MINISAGAGTLEKHDVEKARGSLDEATGEQDLSVVYIRPQFCIIAGVDYRKEWKWPTEKQRGSDRDQQRVDSKERTKRRCHGTKETSDSEVVEVNTSAPGSD